MPIASNRWLVLPLVLILSLNFVLSSAASSLHVFHDSNVRTETSVDQGTSKTDTHSQTTHVFFTLPTCDTILEAYFSSSSFIGLAVSLDAFQLRSSELMAQPLDASVCVYKASIKLGHILDISQGANEEFINAHFSSKGISIPSSANVGISDHHSRYSSLQLRKSTFVIYSLAQIESYEAFSTQDAVLPVASIDLSPSCTFNRDVFLTFRSVLIQNSEFETRCGKVQQQLAVDQLPKKEAALQDNHLMNTHLRWSVHTMGSCGAISAPPDGGLGSCPSLGLAEGTNCTFACNAGYTTSTTVTSCNVPSTLSIGSCDCCPLGCFCPTGSTAVCPNQCSAGTYAPAGPPSVCLSQQSQCTTCPAGSFCPGGAAISVCPVGMYCGSGSPFASACPVNTFNPLTGVSSVSGCTTCAAGKYNPITGASSAAACVPDCNITSSFGGGIAPGGCVPGGTLHATASCTLTLQSNFVLATGSLTMTCANGGSTLTSPYPTAAGPCHIPGTPPIGIVSNGCTQGGTLTSGSSCLYALATGFHLVNGSLTQTCSNGTLTGVFAAPDPCGVPTPPTGFTAGTCTSTVSPGSTCVLAVATGYTHISGSLTLTCTAGAYSSMPTATPSCLLPATPTGANANTCTAGTYLASGSSCALTLQGGYTVTSGSLTRGCSSGTLSPLTITPNSCPIATPPTGFTAGGCTSVISSGSNCILTVATGYSLAGGSTTLICTAGSYSAYPTASGNPCSAVSSPPTGFGPGSCTSSIASGSTCALELSVGYSLSTGTTTLTCSAASYSTLPTASANPCPPVAAPPVGSGAGTCNSNVAVGSSCALSVNTGYFVSSGSTSLLCSVGPVFSVLPTLSQKTVTIVCTPPSGGILYYSQSISCTVTPTFTPTSLTLTSSPTGVGGVSVTTTLTFTSATALSLSIQAGTTSGTVSISFTMGSTDGPSFIAPASISFQIAPPATFSITAGLPAIVYVNQPLTLSLTPSEAPTASQSVTIGLSISGASFTLGSSFTYSTAAAQSVGIQAPSSGSGMNLYMNSITGPDLAHYVNTGFNPYNIPLSNQFSISKAPITSVVAGQLLQVDVTPSTTNLGFTLLVSCSTATVTSGSTLTWGPSDASTKSFFIRPYQSNSGSCSYAYSGGDQYRYYALGADSFTITSSSIVLVCYPSSGFGSILYWTDTASCVVSLNNVPASGQLDLTISATTGSSLGTLSTTLVSFTSANGTGASFTFQAGSTSGTVVIHITRGGTAMAAYTDGNDVTLAVTQPASLTISNPVGYWYVNQAKQMTVTLSEMPTPNSGVVVQLSVGATDGSIDTTSVYVPAANPTNYFTLIWTAPPTGSTMTLTVTPAGGDSAHYTVGTRTMTLSVQSNMIVDTFPSQIWIGQTVSFNVGPASPPPSDVTVTIGSAFYGNLISNVMAFTSTASSPQAFTYVPTTVGTETWTIDYSGTDVAKYIPINFPSVTILQPTLVSVSCPSTNVYYTQTITCYVSLSTPPALSQTLRVNTAVSGTGTGTADPFVNIGSGSTFGTFTFTASSTAGLVTISYSLSGTAVAQYLSTVAFTTLTIVAPVPVSVTCTPYSGSILYYGQTASCQVAPSAVPSGANMLGVTYNIGGTSTGFTDNPSTSFYGTKSPSTFVYTANFAPGTGSVSFTLGSSAQLQFSAPAAVSWTITTPKPLYVDLIPSYWYYNEQVTLQLSPTETPTASKQLDVTVTTTGTLNSASTLSFTTMTPQAITITAPPSGTSFTFTLAAGGTDGLHYDPNTYAPYTIFLATQSYFTKSALPSLISAGQSFTMTLTPNFATTPGGGVVVSIGATGGTISGAPLNFPGNSGGALSFTYTAGASGSGGITYTLTSGVDVPRYQSIAGDSFSIAPTSALSIACSPPSTVYYTQVVTCTVTPNGSPIGSLDIGISLVSGSTLGSLSTTLLTFSNGAPLTFTFTAGSTSGSATIRLTRGNNAAPQFTDAADQPLNIYPPSAISLSSYGTWYLNEVKTLTLTPDASPMSGTQVDVSLISSGGSLGSSMLTFSGSIGAVPQTFTLQAPSTGTAMTLSASLSNTDYKHFSLAGWSPATIMLTPQSFFNVDILPAQMWVGQTVTIHVSPAITPTSDVTVTIGGGSSIGTIGNGVLTFTSTTSQGFTFTATSPGIASLTVSISGTSKAMFQSFTFASIPVANVNTGSSVYCFPSPNVYYLQVADCLITLGAAPALSKSLTITMGVTGTGTGGTSISSVTINSGLTGSFSFNAGSVAGPLAIGYTLSGTAAVQYSSFIPYTNLTIIPTHAIFMTCNPSSSSLSPAQVMICDVSPSVPPVGLLNLTITFQAGFGVLNTTWVAFQTGTNNTQKFTYTAPTLTTSTSVTIHLKRNGLAAPQFSDIPNKSFSVQALPPPPSPNSLSITGMPALIFSGEAITLQVTPSPAPAAGTTLNVTITANGVDTVAQFDAGQPSLNVTFLAPVITAATASGTTSSTSMQVQASTSASAGATSYPSDPNFPLTVTVYPTPSVKVAFPAQSNPAGIMASDPNRLTDGGGASSSTASSGSAATEAYNPIPMLVTLDISQLNLTLPLDPSFRFVASFTFTDGTVSPSQVVLDSTSAISGVYVNVLTNHIPPSLVGATAAQATIAASPSLTVSIAAQGQPPSSSAASTGVTSNSKSQGVSLPPLIDQQINDIFHSCSTPSANSATPCAPDAQCVTQFSPVYNTSFTCVCSVGYEGFDCRSAILQGAKLNLLPQSNNLISYTGNSTDPCLTASPCLNGGTCHYLNSTFACSCLPGFFSATCEFSIVACDGCVTSYSLANHTVSLLGTNFQNLVILNVSGILLTKRDFTVAELPFASDEVQRLFISNGGSDFWPTGLPLPATMSVMNFTSPRLIKLNESDLNEAPTWTLQSVDKQAEPKFWHAQAWHQPLMRRLTASTTTTTSTSSSSSVVMSSRFQPLTTVLQNSQTSTSLLYPTLMWYSASSCIGVGEFQPDGAGGCLSCPVGGQCPGGGRCYPAAGYWSPNEFTAPSQCKNSYACPGVDMKLVSTGTTSAVQTTTCATGFEGARCESCSDGYYASGGSCWKCAANDANDAYFTLIFILAVSVLVLLSFAVCFLSASGLSTIICLFLVIQTAVAVGQSGVQSLPSSYQGLSRIFTILSVLNFDVQMFTPGCSVVPQLSFIGVFWLTLLYALLALFLFITACYMRRFMMSCIRNYQKNHKKVEPEQSKEGEAAGKASNAAARKLEAREDFRRRCIHSIIILGMLFYFKLTTLCMQGLHCIHDPDAAGVSEGDVTATKYSFHLYSDPTVECFQGTHIPTVIVIFLLLIFYCFCFPLLCLVILTRVFASSETRGLVGWLFRNFKLFQPTAKDKEWIQNKYVVGINEDIAAAAVATTGETNDPQKPRKSVSGNGSLVKKQQQVTMAKEFEILVQDCFGVMFSGLNADHFFFRLTFLLVQAFTAIVTEYVNLDAISLRLFLLGLINAIETLAVCIYLPFLKTSGNIRMAAVYWAEMTHCALMLGLQRSSLNDKGLQYFYAFLGVYGVICVFLLFRRKLGQWIPFFALPEDNHGAKKLDTDDDIQAGLARLASRGPAGLLAQIEAEQGAEQTGKDSQRDSKSDSPGTKSRQAWNREGVEMTAPVTAGVGANEVANFEGEPTSPGHLIRVDPSRTTATVQLTVAESPVSSPSASDDPELSEAESLVPPSDLTAMLDLMVRANTIESDLEGSDNDTGAPLQSIASIASVFHAVSKLSTKLHNKRAALASAEILPSVVNADDASDASGASALRLAAACMIEQRLNDAHASGDAAQVEYFSSLYRQLVESHVATSVHAESQRSAADAAMLEKLKRGKSNKAQALIDTALNNAALLAAFRLEEEDRQRQIMEAKIRAREEKKKHGDANAHDDLTAEEEAAVEASLPFHPLALHNMLDEICDERQAGVKIAAVEPVSDPSNIASGLRVGVMMQSLRFAAACLVKKRLATSDLDPAQTDYFTALYRQLVSSAVATASHSSNERSAADSAMLEKLKKGKSKQASRLIEVALNNEAILDVFRLEEEDRQRRVMEEKIKLKMKAKQQAQPHTQSQSPEPTEPELLSPSRRSSTSTSDVGSDLRSPLERASSPTGSPENANRTVSAGPGTNQATREFLSTRAQTRLKELPNTPHKHKKHPSLLLRLTEDKRTDNTVTSVARRSSILASNGSGASSSNGRQPIPALYARKTSSNASNTSTTDSTSK